MSKIEDALKKAKENIRINTSLRPHIAEKLNGSVSVRSVTSNAQFESKTSIVQHVSSAKEIALMEEREPLSQNKLLEHFIIYADMPDTQLVTMYRDLRTKILQKSKGENFVVMLTSCVADKDVNNIVINLAAAFAFDESKTSLVIDCNLNNPQLDSIFGISNSHGLTDYLESDTVDVESIIHKTGIKRLRMIPVGSSREVCTEYFTSSRMRKLMSDLIARYKDRYIFINSAPITESADTRILVDMCDFVILIVPYGAATKTKIKLAADAVGNEKLLGVIFDSIPTVPIPKIFRK